MQKEKVVLGFDIGTTSVGWSIMNENKDIVNYGVRLFPDAGDEKTGESGNKARRDARSQRRRLSRSQTRIRDFNKLLLKYKLISSEEKLRDIFDNNERLPFDIKIEATQKGVCKKDLIFILYHYLNHRGAFYDLEEDIAKLKHCENVLPSFQQKEFYSKEGYISGSTLNSGFKHALWLKEVEKVLSVQTLVNDEFKKEYLEIFNRIRPYSQGPGSEKHPTKYGLWREENGKVIKKYENLWEGLIGKCSRYTEENRANKKSASASLFNFLNELNNIRKIDDSDWRISKKEKELILNKALASSGKISVPQLKKILGMLKAEELKLSDKNKLNTDISNIANFNKKFAILFNFQDLIIKNPWEHPDQLNILNDLIDKRAKHQKNTDGFINEVKNSKMLGNITLSEEQYKTLSEVIKSESKTHSLSIKALNEDIPELYIDETGANQMNLRTKGNNTFENDKLKKIKGRKYIPADILDNEIISPTAKRSFRQAIKVLNKIIENKNLDISKIVIEMARDRNSAEEKANISKTNKYYDNLKKRIVGELGLDENSRINITKMVLLEQQGGLDIYTGKPLDRIQVATNPAYCEIDHIIPYSISFDDSRSNKVLTLKENNQLKGDKTPFQWLNSGKYENMMKRAFIFVGDPKNKELYDSKKYRNLSYKLDPLTDKNFAKEFIGKNLSDTRYAIRLFYNLLQDFFKINNKDIQLVSINGKFTNYLRNRIFDIRKDRNKYEHHAVDATMCAYAGLYPSKFLNLIRYISSEDSNQNMMYNVVDHETGEVTRKGYDYKNVNKLKEFMEENSPNFSRMIEKKENTSFYNETLYAFVKGHDNKTYKITKKRILDSDVQKDMFEKNADSYLMYKNDNKKYIVLKNIYEKYKSTKNPFESYLIENNITQKKYMIYEVDGKIEKLSKVSKITQITPGTFVEKSNNKGSKITSGFTSLNWLWLQVYKNDKNKFVLIPINVNLLKFDSVKNKTILDNDKLDSVLESKNIFNKKYIRIDRGTIVIQKETKELFYITGSTKDKIEIKYLHKVTEKQTRIAVNVLLSKFDFVQTDILGKIYKK